MLNEPAIEYKKVQVGNDQEICHSFKSHKKHTHAKKKLLFILSHASLRIILSNKGDAVSIDKS